MGSWWHFVINLIEHLSLLRVFMYDWCTSMVSRPQFESIHLLLLLLTHVLPVLGTNTVLWKVIDSKCFLFESIRIRILLSNYCYNKVYYFMLLQCMSKNFSIFYLIIFNCKSHHYLFIVSIANSESEFTDLCNYKMAITDLASCGFWLSLWHFLRFYLFKITFCELII